MSTMFSHVRGLLLFGAFITYYMWLFVGTENSGVNSLYDKDKLIEQFDFVSPHHFESGGHETKLQIHPFDEPRAREMKTRLQAKTSGKGAARSGLQKIMADDVLFQIAVQSDRHAMQQLASMGITRSQLNDKVAFLFLVERDIPLQPLWANFFRGNGDRHNIYVHLNPSQPSVLLGVFNGRSIPSLVAEPNTPSFIAAARRLMANAILEDPLNEWFALLSDACIPLHSFDYIYNTLKSTNKSFVEINRKRSPFLWYRYVARGVHTLEPEVSWADFKMGSKWWIMRKKHALMFLKDTKYWNKFRIPCLPEHKMCHPEQHYFSTVLSILDKNGTTGKGVMLQNDEAAAAFQSDRPRTFTCGEINGTFLSLLQSKNNGQWLFAQRFSANCLEKLFIATRRNFHHPEDPYHLISG